MAGGTEKWTAGQIPSQSGKTILVTGANSGIGYQAALEVARRGAHILLGCRNAGKGEAALERLRREAPGATAELVLFDLASLASLRDFAEKFLAGGQTLDVLINNAGVMSLPSRELTIDGFERQMGTNHLGHFALTGLLFPALRRSAAPRVVTVASLAHRGGRIDLDNLQSERSYGPKSAYDSSKLANLLFANELDRRARAAGMNLISVAAHPGWSQTSIVTNGPGVEGLAGKVMTLVVNLMGQSDAMGALPTEYAATMPDLRGGEYIGPDGFGEIKGNPKVVEPRANALDEGKARELWVESERLTGVTYP